MDERDVALIRAAQTRAGHGFKDLKALGLESLPNAFLNEAAFLGHAERGEAIEQGERLLAQHAAHGFGQRLLLGRHAAGQVVDAVAQQRGGLVVIVVKAGELLQIKHAPVLRIDAVQPLQLVIELVGQ